MDRLIDSSNLLSPLHESEPDVSLEELQHFLANAPPKPNMTLRYSLAALSVSAVMALLLFLVLPHRNEQILHHEIASKTSIAASKQTRAHLGRNENIAQSKSTNPSNHKRFHSAQKNFIAPGAIANNLIPAQIDACSIPSETSTTPALSSDFTQPTLLCANTSSPVINDFGSNTTQASYPFYEK